MNTTIPALPATLATYRVQLPLRWPGRGGVTAFVLDGDLVLDAEAVARALGAPGLPASVPADFEHVEHLELTGRTRRTLLWTRRTLDVAVAPIVDRELWGAFKVWFTSEHHEACVVDLAQTIEDALPVIGSPDGDLFTFTLAARRIGGGASRHTVISCAERNEWIERDPDASGSVGYRPTQVALARRYMDAFQVKTPRGTYMHSFITVAGLRELRERIAEDSQPALVEVES